MSINISEHNSKYMETNLIASMIDELKDEMCGVIEKLREEMNTEIKNKNEENKNLKEQNQNLITEISKFRQEINDIKKIVKPKDYEPDIFKASEQGKLDSIGYLVEIEHIDATKSKDNSGWTPLHKASMSSSVISA